MNKGAGKRVYKTMTLVLSPFPAPDKRVNRHCRARQPQDAPGFSHVVVRVIAQKPQGAGEARQQLIFAGRDVFAYQRFVLAHCRQCTKGFHGRCVLGFQVCRTMRGQSGCQRAV